MVWLRFFSLMAPVAQSNHAAAPTAASDHGTFCEPPPAVRSGGLRRGERHPVGLFRWQSQPLLEADERPSQLADQLTQN